VESDIRDVIANPPLFLSNGRMLRRYIEIYRILISFLLVTVSHSSVFNFCVLMFSACWRFGLPKNNPYWALITWQMDWPLAEYHGHQGLSTEPNPFRECTGTPMIGLSHTKGTRTCVAEFGPKRTSAVLRSTHMVSVKVNSFEGYNCPVFLSFERTPTVGRQGEVVGSSDGQVWIFLQLQACSFFF